MKDTEIKLAKVLNEELNKVLKENGAEEIIEEKLNEVLSGKKEELSLKAKAIYEEKTLRNAQAAKYTKDSFTMNGIARILPMDIIVNKDNNAETDAKNQELSDRLDASKEARKDYFNKYINLCMGMNYKDIIVENEEDVLEKYISEGTKIEKLFTFENAVDNNKELYINRFLKKQMMDSASFLQQANLITEGVEALSSQAARYMPSLTKAQADTIQNNMDKIIEKLMMNPELDQEEVSSIVPGLSQLTSFHSSLAIHKELRKVLPETSFNFAYGVNAYKDGKKITLGEAYKAFEKGDRAISFEKAPALQMKVFKKELNNVIVDQNELYNETLTKFTSLTKDITTLKNNRGWFTRDSRQFKEMMKNLKKVYEIVDPSSKGKLNIAKIETFSDEVRSLVKNAKDSCKAYIDYKEGIKAQKGSLNKRGTSRLAQAKEILELLETKKIDELQGKETIEEAAFRIDSEEKENVPEEEKRIQIDVALKEENEEVITFEENKEVNLVPAFAK